MRRWVTLGSASTAGSSAAGSMAATCLHEGEGGGRGGGVGEEGLAPRGYCSRARHTHRRPAGLKAAARRSLRPGAGRALQPAPQVQPPSNLAPLDAPSQPPLPAPLHTHLRPLSHLRAPHAPGQVGGPAAGRCPKVQGPVQPRRVRARQQQRLVQLIDSLRPAAAAQGVARRGRCYLCRCWGVCARSRPRRRRCRAAALQQRLSSRGPRALLPGGPRPRTVAAASSKVARRSLGCW
jgi:hypothetical protein